MEGTRGATAASAASVFLLFADRLVPKKKVTTRGAQVPGKKTKVQMGPLARLLVACSLWSMREQGVLTLTLAEESLGLSGTKPKAVVRVEPTGKEATSIERDVCALIPAETTAHAVASALVGRGSEVPEWDVIRWFIICASAEGFVDVDFSLFKTGVRPVAERAADAEVAFSAFGEAWTTFQEREPDLCKVLFDDCKLGIDAKRVYNGAVG